MSTPDRPSFTLTVSFDPDATPQFTYQPSNTLTIASSPADIILQLQQVEGHRLAFSDSPITWIGPAPSFLSPKVDSPTQMTVVDRHTAASTNSFLLNVLYDGVPYTSTDPTILNVDPPPTQGFD